MAIKDVITGIGGLADKADNLYQDEEERSVHLSERHKVDMLSDSWLSKNIRPMAFLFSMLCQLILVVGSLFVVIDPWIIAEVGTILATTTGFYFASRKAEKTAAQNAKANIEIEKIKVKADVKEERKDARNQRRLNRIEARDK